MDCPGREKEGGGRRKKTGKKNRKKPGKENTFKLLPALEEEREEGEPGAENCISGKKSSSGQNLVALTCQHWQLIFRPVQLFATEETEERAGWFRPQPEFQLILQAATDRHRISEKL